MAPPPMAVLPGGHVCGLGATPETRGELAAAWVREGLEAGERVLWIGPGGDPALAWLSGHGVAWQRPAEDGALAAVGVEEVLGIRSAADIPDRIDHVAGLADQALNSGYKGLRMGTEVAAALACMPDLATQFRFEAVWEALTLSHPVSLLCLYDPGVYGTEVARAVTAHPRALADGMLFAAVEGGRLRVSGEVDLSNVEMFGRFVAVAAGDGDLVVDLAGLSFIDARGTSELVELSRALGPSRRLRVAWAPPMLRRILALSGWAGELDLV